MNKPSGVVWLILALGLVACQPSAPITTRADYAVFGTWVEVQIRHTAHQVPNEALAQLDQLFQSLHRDWHPWEPGALTGLNQGLLTGQWVAWPPVLGNLLQRAQQLESLSSGQFNAAIGQLVGLWGFHTSNYPITTPPPSQEAIDALMARPPSALDIEWEDRGELGLWVRSKNTAIALDFSGMAKGAAAEMACEVLFGHGFADALVNLGGDVLVCGPARQPWRVAIYHPQGGMLDVLEVHDRLAVFTSGQYHRYGEWQGERYAHVLDPSTGSPVQHILQATAIHDDAVLADAAATALVVAGQEHASALGQQLGLKQWSVVDETGQVQWMAEN